MTSLNVFVSKLKAWLCADKFFISARRIYMISAGGATNVVLVEFQDSGFIKSSDSIIEVLRSKGIPRKLETLFTHSFFCEEA